MRDITRTIITQYQHSPRLLSLIRSFHDRIDPAPATRDFYAKVFDPATAEGRGLNAWGVIVAMGRTQELKGTSATFGFAGSELHPFNQGTFYNAEATETYTLADNAYRLLIWCKAASNLTDGSLRDLNRILSMLFADQGRAMVLHSGTMMIRYVFEFRLQPFQRALLLRDDVPPKPAGVGYEVFEVPYPAFGFAGSGFHPFNQGTFVPGGPVNAYSFN